MALLRPVPPSSALAALVSLMLVAPPQIDLRATAVDPVATTAGLHARVGALEDWSITAEDDAQREAGAQVVVSLRSPDGRSRTRRVALIGPTAEDRSRELAASLALLIEQWDDPPEPEPPSSSTDPDPDPEPPPPMPIRGWLGVGPRLEVGRARVEGGLDLQGGAWLLREHLQPLGSLGWSVMARDGLSLHTVRFGAGVAVGAPLLAGRLWLGAHGLAHAAWTRVQDNKTADIWASSSELGGLLQVRGERWLLGVRTGVDLALPELRARGNLAQLGRGPVHWVLAVGFAVLFGRPRSRAQNYTARAAPSW